MNIEDEHAGAEKFLREKNPTFPVFFAGDVKKQYEVFSIPANFFVDTRNHLRIKGMEFGPRGEKQFALAIEELLKEKNATSSKASTTGQ